MNYRQKKVAFGTLGCKLNFSETSTIARSFQEQGFERVDFKENADIYVINTCSVTDAADKKSRAMIRQANRQNPAAFVVVIGCYAQLKPDEAAGIEGVDLVLGANDKFNITRYLENLEKHDHSEVHTCSFNDINEFQHAFSYGDRTRSFLKVQDGCNYFCSYCTIPLARGKSRNPSIGSLVAEASALGEQGIQEIILTGVNIGDFGRSTGESFIDLLHALDRIDTVGRIRIGSVEPNLMSDEVIGFIAGSERIAPHFHIPLQAGSDEILGLMKRRYDTTLFSQRIEMIRSKLPYAYIGVDVIAGMSGESDELFEKGYNFISGLPVSQLHAFPYSERANTQALKIGSVVPVEERKRRTQRLIALSDEKMHQFYLLNRGREENVLFEKHRSNGMMTGLTSNYLKVVTPYRSDLVNRFKKVVLQEVDDKNQMTIKFIEE